MKKLRFLRAEAGLTQQELGDKLQVSKAAISKLEVSSMIASKNMEKKLCEVFNCKVEDLYTIKENIIHFPTTKEGIKKMIDDLMEEYENWED